MINLHNSDSTSSESTHRYYNVQTDTQTTLRPSKIKKPTQRYIVRILL